MRPKSPAASARTGRFNKVDVMTNFAVRTLSLLLAGIRAVAASDDATTATLPVALEVPPGFTVELVAGPPLVGFPMMAAFDDRGRLFIAESDGQNLGKEALLEQQPRFVRMIEDTDGDGHFDRSTIYADAMVMPEGALWHNHSLFIMSAPYLWRLDDTDGDGVADHREQLLGEMDLIGNANQHGPYLTPAGRLLFSGGTFGYHLVPRDGGPDIKGNWASVFSCRADGSDVRVECHAGINPVEVEFTEEGEMLGTCAIFDRVGGRCDALVHWVHGGSYAEPLRAPNLKQTGRYLPAATRWGQVAPSGLVRMRGGQFGEDYRGNLFACLFNTHELVRIRLVRIGATFRGDPEVFLRSTDPNFHPADVLEDADGSLLLIDTGAWLTMGCPTSKSDTPAGYGGIYRIRKVNGAMLEDPRGTEVDWQHATADELAARLDDSRPAVQDRAAARFVELGDAALSALRTAMSDPDRPVRRRQATWALSRIGTAGARALVCQTALMDPDPSVRQAAVHAVGVLREPAAVHTLMQIVVHDDLPIRREAATALGLIGDAGAVPALFASLTNAKDEFLEHALVYALIEIGDPAAIQPGLADDHPRVQRAALIALDQVAEESLTNTSVAGLLASNDPDLQRAALDVVVKHPTWSAELIGLLRGAFAAESLTSSQAAIITGTVTAFPDDPTVQSLVAQALGRQAASPEQTTILLEAIGRSERSELPEPWIGPLEGLLSHSDEAIRRQLLVSLTAFDPGPLIESLRSTSRDVAQPPDIRVAALGLIVRNAPELAAADLQLLIDQLDADVAPAERMAAAHTLATADLTAAQLRSLLEVVQRAGPLELGALLRTYETAVQQERLSNDAAASIGRELIAALVSAPGIDALPASRIHAVFADFPVDVANAAKERFPDQNAATAEQLAKLDALDAETGDGDPASGQQLFSSNRLACASCHRINGQGGAVGPDLSQIAKVRSRRHLAEAVLLPSQTLANGFESYNILTRSGRTLSGLIRRETASAVHLLSTDGHEDRVPRDEIEEIQPSHVSVMPQGLDRQLSDDQLRDLLAFLQTLK